MHSLMVLKFMWLAVVVFYCALAAFADRRLRGAARKRNKHILWAMAVLIAVRIWTGHKFGGLAFLFGGIFVGAAAGVAALIVATMLVSREPGDEAGVAEGKERIQSLKLN